MSLFYVHSEMVDERRDFLADLREHEVETLLPSAGSVELHGLNEVKEDLHRLDRALTELCGLNPKYAESYKAQHATAIQEIEARVQAILPHRKFNKS